MTYRGKLPKSYAMALKPRVQYADAIYYAMKRRERRENILPRFYGLMPEGIKLVEEAGR